jgi:hypothetical protein
MSYAENLQKKVKTPNKLWLNPSVLPCFWTASATRHPHNGHPRGIPRFIPRPRFVQRIAGVAKKP